MWRVLWGSKISNINSVRLTCPDKSFGAVFGIRAAFVGFVMDQCLHANGNKWMSVVVVLFEDMRICG